MTTSAYATPGSSPRLTYARARLLLGISGVGTAVLIATTLLFLDLPTRLASVSLTQPLHEAIASLAKWWTTAALIFLPFDVLGGAVIVRSRRPLHRFIARWLRGVTAQLAVVMASALVIMLVARTAGDAAAIASVAAMQLVLAELRVPLARAVAALRLVEIPERVYRLAERSGIARERLRMVDAADEGFVGGWSGISGRALIVPAHWEQLPDESLAAALTRRRIIAESGAHRRGVLYAVAWNTLGLAMVVALFDVGLGSAAGVLTAIAGMTLWAFLGVLLLPTPSRWAVFAVDVAATGEVGAEPLREAIERLDRWQDDEARRSPGVETIFHPVPSRTARHARLREPSTRLVSSRVHGTTHARDAWHAHRLAHHLARHALWLGWATLSPLARLVHCNVGRPALWVMLPGD